MAIVKPRTRMISVRLSEEEYAALTHFCLLTGARSVSGLTRDAMRAVLRKVSNPEEVTGGSLEEFRAGIKRLSEKLEQLEAMIVSIKD